MAKSLRSKRARKMRAIKRVRYGAKELTRLENMIKKTVESGELAETNAGFKLVSPPPPSASGKRPFCSHHRIQSESIPDYQTMRAVAVDQTSVMEVDTKKVDPKTMRDQLGNYPEWFNQKRIKRMQRSRRRQGKKKRKNNS